VCTDHYTDHYTDRYTDHYREHGGIGQVFQVGDTVLHHWKAGLVISWPYLMPHLAMNGGTQPKYTLQITGLCNATSLGPILSYDRCLDT
jgi:hypothetical protein